jgi:hypothetical protein
MTSHSNVRMYKKIHMYFHYKIQFAHTLTDPQRLHHAGECGAEEEVRHWNHQPGGLILWPEPRLHQLNEQQAHTLLERKKLLKK